MKRVLAVLTGLCVTLATGSSLLAQIARTEVDWDLSVEKPQEYSSSLASRPTTDGGYIATGAWDDGQQEVFSLLKTYSDGTIRWHHNFPGIPAGVSVEETVDGGYVAAAGSTDVYLVKTDPEGLLEFVKVFDTSAVESAAAVRQTADGGYVVVGRSRATDSEPGDIYLIRTDLDGELLWERTYGTTSDEQGRSVLETADGGLVVAGRVSDGIWEAVAYLMKTDAQGDLLWETVLGGDRAEANAVAHVDDGGFIVVGTEDEPFRDDDLFLARTDAQGSLLWSGIYGRDVGHVEGFAVTQTADGGFAVGGGEAPGFGYAYVLRTDADGGVLWEGTLPRPSFEAVGFIQQTADRGYLLTGICRLLSGNRLTLIRLHSECCPRSVRVQCADPAGDSEKVWIRSNYTLGDALVFHPRMVHRGNENVSDVIRLSTDFRYQREEDPQVWWGSHRLAYRRNFLRQVAAALTKANLEQALYNRVYAAMREEGPPPGGSDEAVFERVQELARESKEE